MSIGMISGKNTLKVAGISFSIIGLIDSVYLTFHKVSGGKIYCGNIGDCNAVNSSPFAELYGIPIALLGAGAYAAILFLFIVEDRRIFWQEFVPLILFPVTLVGIIYSAYLTYVEIAILKKICVYCVISAVVMAFLFVIAVIKLISYNSKVTNHG